MDWKSVAIIGTVIAAGAGYYVWQGSQPVPTKSGVPIAQVKVPNALPAAAKNGAVAYQTFCATCHGPNAAGQEGVAPPLVHKIYEPSHHGDVAFLLAAQRGVAAHHWRFGNMPPVADVTEAEVADIVAYIRALQRANGIE